MGERGRRPTALAGGVRPCDSTQEMSELNEDEAIYWASTYRVAAVNFRSSAEALLPSLELRDDGSPAKVAAIPFYFLVSHRSNCS